MKPKFVSKNIICPKCKIAFSFKTRTLKHKAFSTQCPACKSKLSSFPRIVENHQIENYFAKIKPANKLNLFSRLHKLLTGIFRRKLVRPSIMDYDAPPITQGDVNDFIKEQSTLVEDAEFVDKMFGWF